MYGLKPVPSNRPGCLDKREKGLTGGAVRGDDLKAGAHVCMPVLRSFCLDLIPAQV